MAETLFIRLGELLDAQIDGFRAMTQAQQALAEALGKGEEVASLLEMLRRKEEMLTAIRAKSQEARPLIADWMQRKAELVREPEYDGIASRLAELESLVNELQRQEESWMEQFRPTPTAAGDIDPDNRINAFRALR